MPSIKLKKAIFGQKSVVKDLARDNHEGDLVVAGNARYALIVVSSRSYSLTPLLANEIGTD